MKYKFGLLLVIVAMVAAALSVPSVQAGKPQPYPPPGGDFEIQAYPAPQPTELPVQGLPTEWCTVPGKACVWGWFSIGQYGPAWWVSIDGIGIQPDIPDGMVCITPYIGTEDYCDQLRFTVYNYNQDRNWYRSYDKPHCGHWFVYMVYLNGQPGEIRQPNDWMINCVYLPGLRKG